MTSKTKRILIISLLAVILTVAAVIFSACSVGVSVDGLKNTYGLSAHIVYHANGGIIKNTNVADLYFPEGVTAVYLTDDGEGDYKGNISVTRSKYSLAGWYYPATDSNGNIVYLDEEKDIAKLGEKFDFENTILQKGDEIHLYAKWVSDRKLEILLAPDESINNQLTYNGVTYNVGDLLNTWDFEESGKVAKITKDPMTGKSAGPTGYVFAEYFEDEGCTTPVSWPIIGDDSDNNVQIYAKYLTSNWIIISKSSDLYQLYTPTKGNEITSSFYIKNDVKFAGNTATKLTPNVVFTGEIRGNGYTISNLNLKAVDLVNLQNASIFGTLSDTAYIHDLTLKNATVEISGKSNCAIDTYFLFYMKDEGAKLENVVIDGGSMKVTVNDAGSWNGSTEESDICPVVPEEVEGLTIEIPPTFKVYIQISKQTDTQN